MDYYPLMQEEIEAGLRFLHELEKVTPGCVTFWLKEPERHQWDFYVTSAGITGRNHARVRARVSRLLHAMRDPYLDTSSVRVIRATEPLANAAITTRASYESTIPIRRRDIYFGGKVLDEIYIYAMPATVPES